jgi:hypothetical protein
VKEKRCESKAMLSLVTEMVTLSVIQ